MARITVGIIFNEFVWPRNKSALKCLGVKVLDDKWAECRRFSFFFFLFPQLMFLSFMKLHTRGQKTNKEKKSLTNKVQGIVRSLKVAVESDIIFRAF